MHTPTYVVTYVTDFDSRLLSPLSLETNDREEVVRGNSWCSWQPLYYYSNTITAHTKKHWSPTTVEREADFNFSSPGFDIWACPTKVILISISHSSRHFSFPHQVFFISFPGALKIFHNCFSPWNCPTRYSSMQMQYVVLTSLCFYYDCSLY